MGRFNQGKYDPLKDSTPKFGGLVRGTKCVVLQRYDGECPCGCGEKPVSDRTTFRMGHDAKLRGKLIRAHLTDTQVIYVTEDGAQDPVDAAGLAEGHGWTPYIESAVQRRTGANKALLHRAMNSKRLIRVGRWPYTGQVVAIYDTPGGEEYDVEYITKQGETRKVRVPAADAPLAPSETEAS